MFFVHRVLINARRIAVTAYYRFIYRDRFVYGKHFKFRGNFKLYIEPTGCIEFGDNCFVNNYFSATSIKEIKIGNDCIFGEGVKIYDHNHKYREKDAGIPIHSQGFTSKEVSIGNNCWIASNVTILAGVHIGDNCVIGANCLIYKDVPTGSVIKHKEELLGGGTMKPKVSIIIPVYKVEKFLNRCLDSVLGQTLKEIEIILVDDGSPDNCGRICDEYAAKDKRVIVIHKKNAGVSAARNSGLEVASGEFVGFVDSDDYVAATMFEDMYRQAVLADAEMAMCQFSITDGATDQLVHRFSGDDFNVLRFDNKKAFELIADFSCPVQVTVWNKLFKRELIQNLRFDTSKRMAEDLEFLMRALFRSKTVVYVPYALYAYYAQREGAATFHADHSIAWYLEQNSNITSIMDEVAQNCASMKKLAIGYKCVNGDLSIANAMVRAGKLDSEAVKLAKKDLKNNIWEIMTSELHAVKKVQMLLFIVSPALYMKVMKKKLVG